MSEEKETTELPVSEPEKDESKKVTKPKAKKKKEEPSKPAYRIVSADHLTTIDDGFDKVDRFLKGDDDDEGDDYDGDLADIGD